MFKKTSQKDILHRKQSNGPGEEISAKLHCFSVAYSTQEKSPCQECPVPVRHEQNTDGRLRILPLTNAE